MEQINKQFVIGGASAQEQQNALVQLSQAMSAGALRGEELNSILDAAPGIARAIEQSMGWAEGSIKSYAEKGMVTAETVKASMLNMADQTDTAFESMSVTFSQVLTDIQDDAIIAFQPVLQSLNDIANSEAFNSLVDTAIQGLTTLANSEALQRFVSEIENMLNTLNQSGFFAGVVNGVAAAFQFLIAIATVAFDLLGGMAGFIAENWSIIAPVIYGVAALAAYCIALGIYNGIQLISNGIKAASAFAENVHAASLAMETGQTFAATVAQYGFNAALMACPITWIIIMVIALIAIFYAVIGAINKFAGTSISATGVICGAFMVALAIISNIFVTLWNVVVDVFVLIYNLIVEVANFIANAFTDPVGSVCRLFFGLADTVLGVLETLASAVDTLFGSNLAGAVSGWRETLSGWVDDTFGKGEEVWEKIDGSSLKLERYDYKDAYDSGYSFGKGIDESVSNLFDPSSSFGGNEMKSVSGVYKQPGGGAGFGGGAGGSAAPAAQIAANTGQTAANTAAIADSLDVSNEQLKYLRDVAERDAVNRFTTASIKVEMTNNNNVSSGMDLDGIVDSLTTAVGDAMSKTATGVHF